MLELRNLLNIKEYSEKLRSKKKIVFEVGPRKEGDPNVLVNPPLPKPVIAPPYQIMLDPSPR
jgi:hypothetical protein